MSGAGAAAAPLASDAPPAMPDALRQAAVRGDWAAWQSAWAELDAIELRALRDAARRGEPVVLTLCGERHAQRWTSVRRGAIARLGQRFKNLLGTSPAWKVLESL